MYITTPLLYTKNSSSKPEFCLHRNNKTGIDQEFRRTSSTTNLVLLPLCYHKQGSPSPITTHTQTPHKNRIHSSGHVELHPL